MGVTPRFFSALMMDKERNPTAAADFPHMKRRKKGGKEGKNPPELRSRKKGKRDGGS